MTPGSEAAPAVDAPYSLVIVEDDADIRDLLRIVLARDGRLVAGRAFDNAEDAVAAVRHDCPDAILCDVGLPGMSGLEALPLLRAACPTGVIVMYTANPEGSQDAMTSGADAVVGKDTVPTRLVEQVVELLERRT